MLENQKIRKSAGRTFPIRYFITVIREKPVSALTELIQGIAHPLRLRRLAVENQIRGFIELAEGIGKARENFFLLRAARKGRLAGFPQSGEGQEKAEWYEQFPPQGHKA